MAGSVNKVILVGNLGADPEIRRSNDGKPIANITIATSDTWRDKNSGERKEKTEWHKVVIFNEGIAKIAEQYLKKGSKVYIEGKLQTRKWQDQQGNDRYSTEIVLENFRGELQMLTSGEKSEGGSNSRQSGGDYGSQSGGTDRGSSQSSSRGASGGGTGGGFGRDIDDEIPFAMEWR